MTKLNINLDIDKKEFKKKLDIRDGKAGKDGKNGQNGKRGIDGKDGIPGINGLDGSPDSPEEIVNKINISPGRIFPQQIDGLLPMLHLVDQIGKNPRGLEHVGGANPLIMLSNGTVISDYIKEINFSTNLSATYSGNGRVTLSGTGGGAVTSVSNVDGTLTISPTTGDVVASLASGYKIPTTRNIGTTAPLSGGGDLSADRTLTTSMNTNKLIGRGTAGTGVMEEITLGTNLSLSGTTLNATGGSGATTALDNLASVAINTALLLGTSDGAALGSTSKMWSDLFLASGAVINFNNGDVTLTHSANLLTLAGGDFNMPSTSNPANYFNVNVTDSVLTFEFFQSGIKDHLFTMTNAIFSFNGGGVFSGVVTVAGLTNNAVLISVPVGQSTNNSLAGICELWGATGNPTFVQFNEAGIANRGSFGFAAGSSTLAYRSGATTMSDGTQRWAVDNTGQMTLYGKITNYNNIATAGWGTPTVYGSGRSTAQTAAVASVATYTVGAADGSFTITSNVNVTTSTAHSFTVTCTYTDETNTSRTLTLSYIQIGGGTPIATITNVTGAGPYEGVPNHIRCKASTAITVATTGTFTTVTYNVEASIIQIT